MTTTRLGTRLIDYGHDALDELTRIDSASEVDPARAGLSPAAVDAIWSSIESLYRSRVYPALTFCLRRRGEIVLNRSIGYASGGGPDGRPGPDARLAAPDTPICLFSASKAIIALLTHKLAEEGGIDLDAPVSRYVPEFTGAGKRDTTIAEVLSHRGGFPRFDTDGGRLGPETLLDWEQCVRLICDAPAVPGGKQMAYHAITGGFMLGEVIRRVTGAPMIEYLDSRLRRPLGMRYFTYGLDHRSRASGATNYVCGQPVRYPVSRWAREALSVEFNEVVDISNRDFFMEAVIPSGNLYATAEELSRFYQLLLDDGAWHGRQIFQPATVRRTIAPATGVRLDRALKLPMRYSEGLMLGINPVGLYGPMTAHAFGHLGFMNILGWADPQREISAGLLVTGKAIVGGHLIALARTLAKLNWQCR